MPSSEKHCGVLRKADALTLIELLVVIGVIGILAAIIFPILATAKGNGRKTTCLSNLKELGEGMRLYPDEWNGHLPTSRLENGGYGNPSGNWAGVYQVFGKCDPKLGQVFRYVRDVDVYLCPSDRGARPAHVTPDALPCPLSYSMNNIADQRSASSMTRLAGKVGLLIHEGRDSIDDRDFYWYGWTDNWEGRNNPSNIHNGGTCVVYLDLHARWQEYGGVVRALQDGEWDPLYANG